MTFLSREDGRFRAQKAPKKAWNLQRFTGVGHCWAGGRSSFNSASVITPQTAVVEHCAHELRRQNRIVITGRELVDGAGAGALSHHGIGLMYTVSFGMQ